FKVYKYVSEVCATHRHIAHSSMLQWPAIRRIYKKRTSLLLSYVVYYTLQTLIKCFAITKDCGKNYDTKKALPSHQQPAPPRIVYVTYTLIYTLHDAHSLWHFLMFTVFRKIATS